MVRVCSLSKTTLLRFFREVLLRDFQEHTDEHPLAMDQCVNSESEHVQNTRLPFVQEQAIEVLESGLGGTAAHTEREQPPFKGPGVNSERKHVHDAIVPDVQGNELLKRCGSLSVG